MTGVVIGLIPEGAAVIQFGEEAGVPYQGDDQGLEISTNTTPAVGPKVPYGRGLGNSAVISRSSRCTVPRPAKAWSASSKPKPTLRIG